MKLRKKEKEEERRGERAGETRGMRRESLQKTKKQTTSSNGPRHHGSSHLNNKQWISIFFPFFPLLSIRLIKRIIVPWGWGMATRNWQHCCCAKGKRSKNTKNSDLSIKPEVFSTFCDLCLAQTNKKKKKEKEENAALVWRAKILGANKCVPA